MNIADSINNIRVSDTSNILDVIDRYRQYKTPKDASAIYEYLGPTINSAISSYAGGNKDMRVQAYRLAFDAINTFDASRGVNIKTHVFNTLKRLNRINADRSNIVHIPEGLSRDYGIVSKAISDFYDEHNREPNYDEISDITNISKKRIDKILNRNTIVSGSESVTDEGADRVSNKGVSESTFIDYLYSSCDPIDKRIIELTSGKGGSKIHSNIEVARRLNITPAAVSIRMDGLRRKMADLRGLV